jgi:hypothetical protein
MRWISGSTIGGTRSRAAFPVPAYDGATLVLCRGVGEAIYVSRGCGAAVLLGVDVSVNILIDTHLLWRKMLDVKTYVTPRYVKRSKTVTHTATLAGKDPTDLSMGILTRIVEDPNVAENYKNAAREAIRRRQTSDTGYSR